jgi:Icc-related predicted phosphoesterase
VTQFFFASDLHGQVRRYERLWAAVAHDVPDAVFLGGDLLPGTDGARFITNVLAPGFSLVRREMKDRYPRVFMILGNDDPRVHEAELMHFDDEDLWTYVHCRAISFEDYRVYGYAYVPPTPFMLKDWERYDVSYFVDPGCVSPEEGYRSVEIPANETRYATIQSDLEWLANEEDLHKSIFLFHTPPYKTGLDRAELDGRSVDYVPLDVHVGSIAVRRFIESRQPLLTLHGHVHESARLTGKWMDRIGSTVMVGAAHDGPELALVKFDPANPAGAVRELI